ncbi:MlaC/ttg2D family ABC transporter substrate-binding protein [Alteromonas sp. a30]|uniref:MlaC/ttg2D family ABC transporter substrate-binding protein n=1 Tax=Alteromonas sp. a30 TaxID=2730917 RepID=UPI003FA36BBD|nr:ABC transporter substrate-binding protein [Alteromonas sp. a30]
MHTVKTRNGLTLKGFLVALMFVFSGNVLAQDNPYLLLEEVASKTFDRIKTSQKKIKSNPEELKAIVEEELLPYIDYQFAALKVLGKYFRKVPKERIPEYIEVFRTYLIATYAIALGQYEDQTVEFEPPKDYDKRKDVTVRAIISDGERPDIKIAFKVRRNSKTNEWKAYDMVAEGISLLSSKRSELEGILRQDGIEKVIEELSKKNSQPISLQKETAEG